MYLRELDRKCQNPTCTAAAAVEVFNEQNASAGRFCRKDGQQRLRHGSEVERKIGVPLEKVAFTTDAGRR